MSLWCVIIIIIIILKKTATTLIWLQRIESEPIVSLCIKATGDHRSASSFSSGLIQSTPHPKEIFIRKHESFSEYPSLLQLYHQCQGLLYCRIKCYFRRTCVVPRPRSHQYLKIFECIILLCDPIKVKLLSTHWTMDTINSVMFSCDTDKEENKVICYLCLVRSSSSAI